jgi:hypothetical protein
LQFSIDIPDDIAAQLRVAQSDGDLARAAVEQIALAGYVTGTLSRYQVQRLLGFDNRWDTEEWLGSRGAAVQYTLNDLEADRATLAQLLGR